MKVKHCSKYKVVKIQKCETKNMQDCENIPLWKYKIVKHNSVKIQKNIMQNFERKQWLCK